MDEPQPDIRDDVAKWMELLTTVNLPVSTIDALDYGFNISSIGTMQASIRSEADLDDFLYAILFQQGGPLLSTTGIDGWELNLPQNNFRVCRRGAAMTRLWEDCHQAVRVSRMHPGSMTPSPQGNAASFGEAIGQAIEVNLTARGEEPPIPRMDNQKRRELLEELVVVSNNSENKAHVHGFVCPLVDILSLAFDCLYYVGTYYYYFYYYDYY